MTGSASPGLCEGTFKPCVNMMAAEHVFCHRAVGMDAPSTSLSLPAQAAASWSLFSPTHKLLLLPSHQTPFYAPPQECSRAAEQTVERCLGLNY